MKRVNDWKAILIDGVVYEKRTDGTLAPAPNRMDFDRIDAMTEAEIEAFIAEDEAENELAESSENQKARPRLSLQKPRIGS